MAYPVKYIRNAMRGAPTVNGIAGSLVALLDAFLINGWGAVTAQSVAVGSGVATVTLNAGDTFEAGSVVALSGATPNALNGEQRVIDSTNTSITFATNAPDGAATGVISVRYAPAGAWKIAFTDVNKRVYRTDDIDGQRFYYRIDDTAGMTARVRGYEVMTDVDTGTNDFPTVAARPNANWLKSRDTSATGLPYIIAADSRFVLADIFVGPNGEGALRGFGDLNPQDDMDAWCSAVSIGNVNAYNTYGAAFNQFQQTKYDEKAIALARNKDGTFNANGYARSICGSDDAYSGDDPRFGDYNAAAVPPVYVSPVMVQTGTIARATVPGVFHIPQAKCNPALTTGSRAVLNGRSLYGIAVPYYNGLHLNIAGSAFLDVTGPWR